MADLSEEDLLRSALDGNQRAFMTLYLRHHRAVFRFAWSLAGSNQAAEDVTQECFLALVKGAGFDARRGSLRTYLFGIARHLALRRVRLNGREGDEPDESTPAPVNVLGDLLASERSALVGEAIASLPPLQREAIVLFEFEELSLEQIADIAGVETGTVKSRLHRARESLRARLAPVLAPEKLQEKGRAHG